MGRVDLINVTKRFGKVTAVDRVSLNVKDGEFFIILGPSGCGKTTLLRLIAGLEVPDEGEIYIDGRLVNNLHPRDRDVAMVFQNYALYPHMTVLENIMFPLTVRKRELRLSSEDIRMRAIEIAKMLGIADLLDRYPRELSGGQQQRVALARALVRKPKVWLLDEPLSNLDAKLRVQMRWELKALQRRVGITTIYVTHDQVEAMSMADTIAVMSEGRVRQIGKPEDLYLKPIDTFVATFIGTPPMNLVECTIEEETSKVDCLGFKISLNQEVASTLEALGSRELYIGIRPEHVIVSKTIEYKKARVEWFKGKVMIVEPLGSESIVTVNINGQIIKAKTLEIFKAEQGEEVYVGIDLERLLFYDRRTGKYVA